MEDKKIKQSNNKKQLVLTILGVIALVIAVAGISYAVWNYVFNGTLVNTISTNDISLDLLESNTNIIAIENALPMSDNEGKSQTETFDFAVTSKTTKDIDIEYTVSIQKLEVDSGYTSLNDNQIKVYLTDYSGTQKKAPTLISNLTNYKLYTGKHSHDSTHETVQDKFKLRAWIDGAVDASSWNQDTKLQYKFKIGLTSEEKQKSAYPEYVYRYGDDEVSIGDSIESITGTTEDYTTLSQTYFLGHKIGNDGTVERNDVCFIKNSTLYCLKGEKTDDKESEYISQYYEENTNTLRTAFGESNCSFYSAEVYCSDSWTTFDATKYGTVNVYLDYAGCYVNGQGYSYCV